MPVINRATFFFEDDNKHGWSESLHSAKADLTSTMEAAKALLPMRVNLNGQSTRLTFLRVSDDLTKRDSLIYQVPESEQVLKAISGEGDIANTCILVRLDASPVTRRSLYLRGIPDGIVKEAGKFQPTTAWQRSFVIWVEQLKSDGWSCKSRVGINLFHQVVNLVQSFATGRVTVTTADAHGFGAGDPIIITGVKGATQVNGQWSVFKTDAANTFEIVLNQIMGAFTGNGTCKKLGYILAPITKGQVMRVSHRLAGRPFDSPRGRRSKKKLR